MLKRTRQLCGECLGYSRTRRVRQHNTNNSSIGLHKSLMIPPTSQVNRRSPSGRPRGGAEQKMNNLGITHAPRSPCGPSWRARDGVGGNRLKGSRVLQDRFLIYASGFVKLKTGTWNDEHLADFFRPCGLCPRILLAVPSGRRESDLAKSTLCFTRKFSKHLGG
jgi:hypothetical protein